MLRPPTVDHQTCPMRQSAEAPVLSFSGGGGAFAVSILAPSQPRSLTAVPAAGARCKRNRPCCVCTLPRCLKELTFFGAVPKEIQNTNTKSRQPPPQTARRCRCGRAPRAGSTKTQSSVSPQCFPSPAAVRYNYQVGLSHSRQGERNRPPDALCD